MIRWHFGVSKTFSTQIAPCQPHMQAVVPCISKEVESSFTPLYKPSAGIPLKQEKKIKNEHMRLFS